MWGVPRAPLHLPCLSVFLWDAGSPRLCTGVCLPPAVDLRAQNVNYISIKLDQKKNAKLGWGEKEGNFRENSDMGGCGEYLLLVRRYFKCITWIISGN